MSPVSTDQSGREVTLVTESLANPQGEDTATETWPAGNRYWYTYTRDYELHRELLTIGSVSWSGTYSDVWTGRQFGWQVRYPHRLKENMRSIIGRRSQTRISGFSHAQEVGSSEGETRGSRSRRATNHRAGINIVGQFEIGSCGPNLSTSQHPWSLWLWPRRSPLTDMVAMVYLYPE